MFYRSLLLASSLMLCVIVLVTTAHALGTLKRNGDLLAFTSERDGNPEIYLWDSQAGRLVNLSRNPAIDYRPSWSRSDGWLAWVSDRDGNREIYLWNREQITNISNHPEDEYAPVWADDGRLAWLAGNGYIYVWFGVSSRRLASTGIPLAWGWTSRGDLIWQAPTTYAWDGHQIRVVSLNPGAFLFFLFDGSLLWGGNRENPRRFYRWDGRRTQLFDLPFNTGLYPYITQSPQGKWVWSSGENGNWEVYVWDEQANTAVNVSQNASSDFGPHWLPDGRLIWLTRRGSKLDIVIWDGGSTVYIAADVTEDTFPVLSANGILTWQSGGRDQHEIMIWDGYAVRNVSNYPGDDYAPNW